MHCSLLERLEVIASRAERKMQRRLQHPDLRSLCLGAAFLAFVHYGGSVAEVHTFDWERHEEDLTATTARFVRRDVRAQSETHHVQDRRGKQRKAFRVDITTGTTFDLPDPAINQLTTEDVPVLSTFPDALNPTYGLLEELSARMKPKDWEVLTGYHIEGYSLSELAVRLHSNTGAVQRRLSRARVRLREVVEQLEFQGA